MRVRAPERPLAADALAEGVRAVRELRERVQRGEIEALAFAEDAPPPAQPPRDVLVLGAGGSIAAAAAVAAAVPRTGGVARFLETLDERTLSEALTACTGAPEVFVVSKSGTTVETLALAEAALAALTVRYPDINARVTVLAEEGSLLLADAARAGVRTVTLSRTLSGRFSAFSRAATVPLSALGYDMAAFHEGARSALTSFLAVPPEEDAALLSALSVSAARAEGLRILETYWFSPRLEPLGKWYRQLVAETCGKEGKGITPTVAVASADFHSTLQLSLGGPGDKLARFIYVEEAAGIAVPTQRAFPGVLPELSGRTFAEISRAIRESVEDAYRTALRPLATIALPDMTERSLGAFMAFSMLETLYLATLLNVPAFTQPDVEGYKRAVRDRLA